MLTKQTAIDLAQFGIRVVSLSPGWVKTEMGGPEAKYEVMDSVKKILSVTDHLTTEQNGGFWEKTERNSMVEIKEMQNGPSVQFSKPDRLI